MQSFTHSLKDSNDTMSFSINKELMSLINTTLFCNPFNIGENTILFPIFWGHSQFDPYILVTINLVPVIFNL